MLKSKPPAAHLLLTTLLVPVLTAGMLIGDARAHDEEHRRMSGQKLKVSYAGPNSKKNKFQFQTGKQLLAITEDIVLAEDPTVVPSRLLVRVTGANADTTGVIQLDPTAWAPSGRNGWKYKGSVNSVAMNGIKKIQLKSGKKGGKLQIQAQGYWWPLQMNGSVDGAEVMLSMGDHTYCAVFGSDDFKKNEAGKLQGADSSPPADCSAMCGNGIVELGEECDDGNLDDLDTCSNTCVGCDSSGGTEFASTFEGFQPVIFDEPQYGCTNGGCHSTSAGAPAAGLDLTDGNAHASLMGASGAGQPAAINPNIDLVFPGDQDLSLLYLKLASKTLGTPTSGELAALPGGSQMPAVPGALSEDHLEAIRLWIRGGAPGTGVVEGTGALLGSCLPPATPKKIPQPDAPAAGTGVQLAMPGYPLLSQIERELCIASYYDVTAEVDPADMIDCIGEFPGSNDNHGGPYAGKCFAFGGTRLAQDPQSHHSIIRIYKGAEDWTHGGWGRWQCYLGDNHGQDCDPSVADPCPGGGECGGDDIDSVACLSLDTPFGPSDFGFGGLGGGGADGSPQFAGAQEATFIEAFPAGVYNLLPLRGIVAWNSHSFNLTAEDMAMEGWLNIDFAQNRQYLAERLFESNYIFTQNVPVFEEREYCATFTFLENSHLFELTSHTHRFGKRWVYYDAPQEPCGSGPNSPKGYPGTDPDCLPGTQGEIFYENYEYSDPLDLHFPDPKIFNGSIADRTIKYCALYRNGVDDLGNPLPEEVKRQSTSPPPLFPLAPGGPCDDTEVRCVDGPNQGELCSGNDLLCPDSVCDACRVLGGMRTGDEMFIALGLYYIP